jgi:hypothetical protein
VSGFANSMPSRIDSHKTQEPKVTNEQKPQPTQQQKQPPPKPIKEERSSESAKDRVVRDTLSPPPAPPQRK